MRRLLFRCIPVRFLIARCVGFEASSSLFFRDVYDSIFHDIFLILASLLRFRGEGFFLCGKLLSVGREVYVMM